MPRDLCRSLEKSLEGGTVKPSYPHKRTGFSTAKYLLPDELARLTKILETAKPRDRILIQTLLATGARASEILAIQPADLDHAQKTVFIRGLKGSNDREIPLKATLFGELARMARENPAQNLFPISYIRLSQVWGYLRPVKKKLHATRHTFAINLYKRHRDLRLVQVALGHRSISSTLVYADYVFAATELRKLIL